MSLPDQINLGTYYWPHASTRCASSATLRQACKLKGYEFALVYNIFTQMRQPFQVVTYATESEQMSTSQNFGNGFGTNYDVFTPLEPVTGPWTQNVSFLTAPTSWEHSVFLINPLEGVLKVDLWHPFQFAVWLLGFAFCISSSILYHKTILQQDSTTVNIYNFHFSRSKLFRTTSIPAQIYLAIYSFGSIIPLLHYKRVFMSDFSPLNRPLIPFRSIREFVDVDHSYQVAYHYDFNDRFSQALQGSTLHQKWKTTLKKWKPLEPPNAISISPVFNYVVNHPGSITITNSNHAIRHQRLHQNLCVHPVDDLGILIYPIPIYKNMSTIFKETMSRTAQLLSQHGFDKYEEMLNLDSANEQMTDGCSAR